MPGTLDCDCCDPRPKFCVQGTQPHLDMTIPWMRFVKAENQEAAEAEALRVVSAQSRVPTERLTVTESRRARK